MALKDTQNSQEPESLYPVLQRYTRIVCGEGGHGETVSNIPLVSILV